MKTFSLALLVSGAFLLVSCGGSSSSVSPGAGESSGTATTSSSAELPPGSIFEDFAGASPTYFSYGSGGRQAAFTHVSGTE